MTQGPTWSRQRALPLSGGGGAPGATQLASSADLASGLTNYSSHDLKKHLRFPYQ